MKAALYARVSTLDQEPETQRLALRRDVEARGWTAVAYVDRGVSGAKDRRPALDQLLTDARRRRFDVLVCWRLDRLGRSLTHLITRLEARQALGVAFVSLAEGIDATTPASTRQMHILRDVEAEAVALAWRAALGLPGAEPCRGYLQHGNARRGAQPMPERSAQRMFKAADQILKAGTDQGVPS